LRKLIRCLPTKAFLTNSGGWTPDIANATVFSDFLAAFATRNRFDLHDVEIYYSFEEGRTSKYDFALTL
jgi:hypothetical protein